MKTSKSMKARIIRPSSLTELQIEQMCCLYLANHYTDADAFRQRLLSGFDRIALFTCSHTGRVVGFNGMRIKKHRIQGFRRQIRSLYLGQMFVESGFRGQHPIHHACIRALWPVLLFQPWYHCIVWGDSLTYKPFLLIAHTATTYFPNPEASTPDKYKTLMNHLGNTHYGDHYSAETGCVRKESRLLKEHVAPLDARLLRNPLIRFYADQNTQYQSGHGLLVMMDFTWKEVRTIATKLFRHRLKKLSRTGVIAPIIRPIYRL